MVAQLIRGRGGVERLGETRGAHRHPHPAPGRRPTAGRRRPRRAPAAKSSASKAAARDRRADRIRDQRAVQADLQAGAGDSVRHHRGETRGYSSNARWAHGAREMDLTAGQRHELVRYRLPRASAPWWRGASTGGSRSATSPSTHANRVYLIERHVHSRAELAGLVAAHVEHSQQAGCPAVLAQRRQLDELVDAVA